MTYPTVYRSIIESVPQTTCEVTCGNCGKTWKTKSLPPFECYDCLKERKEREFQEEHKHLINGRITAIISNGNTYNASIKALVVCDESGDYWELGAESDGDYGHVIGYDKYKGEPIEPAK